MQNLAFQFSSEYCKNDETLDSNTSVQQLNQSYNLHDTKVSDKELVLSPSLSPNVDQISIPLSTATTNLKTQIYLQFGCILNVSGWKYPKWCCIIVRHINKIYSVIKLFIAHFYIDYVHKNYQACIFPTRFYKKQVNQV